MMGIQYLVMAEVINVKLNLDGNDQEVISLIKVNANLSEVLITD